MSSITQLPELNIFISNRFRDFTKDKTPETLISLANLSEKYKIPTAILWECSLALQIEPQKRDGKIYLTAQDSKQLEQFIKRIEISWACPNILATCRQSPKTGTTRPAKRISSRSPKQL